ncbi:diaminopimelate dehydrogenase [Facklamia sp. DSM 111018]|uniref:Meso-diaminopimelate D-dehydrogenase n=1 Tax=Facklamia lactis TaxID=2749967 RepID=A0ABS0LNJ1_9LACT|nr:diaminopimelate dehydrogenase [Facklamia lactis]MBG9979778.1 diaminopimelate dehydrogenase [Facklamia lactis]MBG9985542.1 diaminopimelate dehydrogenase [Facklamia lactis]
MSEIKIGVMGDPQLLNEVVHDVNSQDDMELVAVFSQEEAETTVGYTQPVKKERLEKISEYSDQIDVLIICSGATTDTYKQTLEYSQYFNVVESYLPMIKLPIHLERVDRVAREHDKLAILALDWAPGFFSLNRLLAEAVLPQGETYQFTGRSVSQGHSETLRRVKGVADAVQYTLPAEEALESVRKGEAPEISIGQQQSREAFVVLEEGADPEQVRAAIQQLPDYFSSNATEVHFISQEEMAQEHQGNSQAGTLIRTGKYEKGKGHLLEFQLNLEAKPIFTASVLVAYARAAYRLSVKGEKGARTILDIPVSEIAPYDREWLIENFL